MTNNIQPSIDFITQVFTTTNTILTECDWKQTEHYPVAALVTMVSSKVSGMTPQRLKDLDPLVRFFIRDNPDYFIGTGSKGGVQRTADRQAKEVAAAAKAVAKKELQAKLDADTSTAKTNEVTQ